MSAVKRFRPADVACFTSESKKNVTLIFHKVWYLSFPIYTHVISSISSTLENVIGPIGISHLSGIFLFYF